MKFDLKCVFLPKSVKVKHIQLFVLKYLVLCGDNFSKVVYHHANEVPHWFSPLTYMDI